MVGDEVVGAAVVGAAVVGAAVVGAAVVGVAVVGVAVVGAAVVGAAVVGAAVVGAGVGAGVGAAEKRSMNWSRQQTQGTRIQVGAVETGPSESRTYVLQCIKDLGWLNMAPASKSL